MKVDPLPTLALDVDVPMVGVRNPRANGQAEAGAFWCEPGRHPCGKKRSKICLVRVLRNADPVVAYSEASRGTSTVKKVDFDLAARDANI